MLGSREQLCIHPEVKKQESNHMQVGSRGHPVLSLGRSLPCPWAWRATSWLGWSWRGWDSTAQQWTHYQPRALSFRGHHTSWSHVLSLPDPPVPQEGGESLLSLLQQHRR